MGKCPLKILRNLLIITVLVVGGFFAWKQFFSSTEVIDIQVQAEEKSAQTYDLVIDKKDIVYGRSDAPITIVEYASLTCSHCASFAQIIKPKLQADYIDSGKVRLVFRHYPLDSVAFLAAQLVECSAEDNKRKAFINLLFARQMQWLNANSKDKAAMQEALLDLGKVGGLSKKQIEACWQDEALKQRITEKYVHANMKLKVRSTPSFIIVGHGMFSGERSYEFWQNKIDALLSMQEDAGQKANP